MYPMGWDAFGLPAENYAIKNNVHPRVSTAKNIANAKRQIQSWGLGFDWDREVNTTDPEFYKWTQWIFLQLYKAGLAYEATGLINWCPKDKTGLANEEVIDGKCDRCGTVVEKKELRQWYLKITAYAEKLLQGLESLPEWPEAVKLQQANWIGKSVGAEIDFQLNKKNNYVIFPGYSSDETENFYPWLMEELSADGSDAQTIVYKSVSENAEPEIIDDLTGRVSLDENTVLVGHSLGGVMAMKLLEKSEVKIAKLVLAASFANPKFKDKARAFEDKLSWDFDFEKIKQNVREIVVLSDTNDHIVPEDSAVELSEKLNARLVKFEATAPHIKGMEEPEVLEAVANRIKVFTTRPDTIFGATYLVVAPEHPVIETLAPKITNWDEVQSYVGQAKILQEQQRLEEGKEKTGVELKGIKAVNPANGEEIPIWTADYVLGNYGTGAIMAVPAHDERDFEFAQIFGLPITKVIESADMEALYTGEGKLMESGEFTGMHSEDALPQMAKRFGKPSIKYKLRDWVFSRQRYWGEPIPLVHCEKCGIVPVPDNQLPVVLPEVENYEPTGTGESPLAGIPEWVNTACPNCEGPAKRETNTMPQWAGSSWYYLRYTDAHNDQEFAGADKLEQWLPVDVYFGGMEHTTLHLLYSRFWHLALYDQGLVPTSEPYTKRVPHGIILAADGEKMSKSRGNVVNPDDIVNKFGADTLRMYELFLGPHEATVSWNDQGIIGVSRFYERIWKWVHEQAKNPADSDSAASRRFLHQLIKKVGDDIEGFRFNTAVSAFMDFHNKVKDEQVSLDFLKTFLVLLYPVAPHISEELNEVLGGQASLQNEQWPEYDPTLLQSDEWNIVVQVNGKVKGKLTVPANTSAAEIEQQALAMDKITDALAGQKPQRIVHVPGKLINIVL
jgi:leucyl-tRNA synthetase